MKGCKAELSTVYCSLKVTVQKPASLFSKPIKCSNIRCFLRCSTNTLSPEENCIITTEWGKGKIIFKGAKLCSSSPPPPKGHINTASQANPKQVQETLQSYLIRVRFMSAFLALLPGFLNPYICHYRFSSCNKVIWRQVLALCHQSW